MTGEDGKLLPRFSFSSKIVFIEQTVILLNSFNA